MLYGILVVYIGLAFIGYLLPLADLLHTTKRGMFKLLPLILIYYRSSPSLVKLSGIITNWENGRQEEKKTTSAKPQAAPARATKK